MKKVAIDARYLFTHNDGMSRVLSLILFSLNTKFNFYLLSNIDKNKTSNYGDYNIYSSGPASSKLSFFWEQFICPILLKKIKPDFFHAPFNGGLPLLTSSSYKSILSIHDLIPYYFPEALTRSRYALWNTSLEISVASANRIITGSNFSKNQIIKYLNIREDKISVIYNSLDDVFINQCKLQTSKVIELDTDSYIVYHGGFRSYKNVSKVLSVYEIFRKKNCSTPLKLHLIGEPNKFFLNSIKPQIDTHPFKKDIIFHGRLSDNRLIDVLSKASIHLYLSRAEGFGYAPLEAMACGTPVICSSCMSLPEILEDGVFWIKDDASENEISESLIFLLNNSKLRADLMKKGKLVAMKYNKAQFTNGMEKVYS